MSVDKFNGEGYPDPTAYEAIKTIEQDEKKAFVFRPQHRFFRQLQALSNII